MFTLYIHHVYVIPVRPSLHHDLHISSNKLKAVKFLRKEVTGSGWPVYYMDTEFQKLQAVLLKGTMRV